MELNKQNQTNPDITSLDRNEHRGWRQWSIDQIYMGSNSKGQYVPNIGDVVADIRGGVLRFKQVTAIDESTLIPTLSPLSFAKEDDRDNNQFKGVGPGYHSETWRIFYDNKVIPHTLMVDSNLHQYGDATYMKIFKGRDTSSTGLVISQYRTNGTDNYSENVPLVTVGNRFDDSSAIKRPMICHTSEQLKPGDIVTAVTYTQNGKPYGENVLMVANASNVRSLDAATAYVTNIELVSPFISPSDDRLLEFPSNMTNEGLFTMARVYYSDGTDRYLTIDQSRVKILGFDNNISTVNNETGSFGLSYQLADNELAWNANQGANRGITEIYRYRVVSVEGSYPVSIVVVPQWIDDVLGYELKYYLFSQGRDVMMDITDYIEVGANSEMFNGRKYGSMQHIVVAVELSKLNLGLSAYRHVQSFDIGLSGNPTNYDVPYLIHYRPNQDPVYGVENRVKMFRTTDALNVTINLNGIANQPDLKSYLNRTYYLTNPLYNEKVELIAPTPTHFVIQAPDLSLHEFPVDKWNQEVQIPNNARYPLLEGNTLQVTWIKKVTPTLTHYLSMTPMVVRY